MNIDDYTKVTHKRFSIDDRESEEKKIKYLKNLITRTLLSIILVLSVSIFIKIDSNNVLLIDEYVFQDSLEFTKINNWYQDNVGKIIPNLNTNTTLVFNSDELKNSVYSDYLDGVKIEVDKSSPISLLSGGIVVFIGEKEGYGNTLILQGNDGIDYWYGNITNLNVNLYDYLEKDTLIGESENNYLYLVLQKDGNYIGYEEYLK
ncbi:MAG: M23 family metallopeptidase [Firmicutes bacterium]|nr:M23 family metallopeptidase [Bacillota bacterium]